MSLSSYFKDKSEATRDCKHKKYRGSIFYYVILIEVHIFV